MKEVDEWWKQAKEDLKTANYNFKGKKFYMASFLSQQAAEKGLKALYIKRFRRLIRVHDLVKLAKDVDAPDKIVELCDKLNLIYTESRYPGVMEAAPYNAFSDDDSKHHLEFARDIHKWLKNQI